MVHVSHETPEHTDARLRGVLAQCSIEPLPGVWWFAESRDEAPTLGPRSLALIRDGDVVSELTPADDRTPGERFRVLRIHFPAELDNSGFVGWLATELKLALGTGVAVICGSNSARGGIYDYWAVPEALGDEALETIRRLGGRAAP